MNEVQDRLKNTIDTGAENAKKAANKAAEMGRHAKGGASQVVDTLKGGAEATMQGVAQVAGQASDKMQEWTKEALEAAGPAKEKVQQWAKDAYDVTSETAMDWGKDVTALLRKYPIPSLLVGFGIGLMVGRSLRA